MWFGASGSLQSGLERCSISIVQFAGLELNQQMLPVFLGLLLVTAVAWFFLSGKFYAQLRQNYPDLNKKLGSPRPFVQKSFLTNFKFIGFLFKDKHNIPLNSEIKGLMQGLKTLFCMYLFCLTGSVILLLERWLVN
jgi:hypothetical protein